VAVSLVLHIGQGCTTRGASSLSVWIVPVIVSCWVVDITHVHVLHTSSWKWFKRHWICESVVWDNTAEMHELLKTIHGTGTDCLSTPEKVSASFQT
jgi:hypothetical protein